MQHISSKLIHGIPDNSDNINHRSLKTPIYETASFDFETTEEMESAFKGESDAFTYSRITNPTVSELEKRLKLFGGAAHCLCVSSGMAAISNVFVTLCASGDNIITSKYLFGNTWSFFAKTLKSFGVEARFVDMEDTKALHQHIDKNTRAIFLELPTNPQLILFDVKSIAAIAQQHNIPLVVDNTVLTPYLFNCSNYGVDIEVFSNTKFISGGATSIGGAILVHNSEKWSHIPKLTQDYQKWGSQAFYKRLYKEIFRNLGACLSPNSAYLQLLGLETITLRIDKVCDNTLAVTNFLANHPNVKQTNSPLLPDSTYHDRANELTGGKTGCLINFELENKTTCYRFMDALKMIRRGTNFCDNKSMIIHPASTIYWDLTVSEKEEMRISEGMIRLSVGLENVQDIIDDINQALKHC
ncbi:aminotransferase class I/II-fold pyridoxal phosphate-dependent enzyme [Alkaliflexus imshenetskii]|uniref:aminotransferase class I/II-fold pyridoxal phosphate-dependent enzyme n=1 Tax=Alkaliflexus imshenetskii TaxID=286730 RepID=UPI00047DD5C0|nr:aminotransferase class I/II-fold pyridoxal phosphate-dependent enzyme [Alkaliflexus imshenetskii]